MKEQATLSLKEISDLRQKLNNVDTSNFKSILSTTTAAVSLPGQPNLPAHLLKPDTPLHVSQLGTNEHDASQPGTLLHLATPQSEVNKVTDINDNMAPNPNRFSHTNSSQDAEALDPDLPHSKKSTPSHTSLTDPESLCNNCHNKPENYDIDMDLPPPIYEPNFIHECPSPWLHYGYFSACLELARFESLQRGQGNPIIEHIAQRPGLLNKCWTGFH